MTPISAELAKARAPTDPSLVIGEAPTPESGRDGPEFQPRQRIGRYELLQRIGVGGMGVVYAAYDRILDRQVAIKLVRGDRSDTISPARMIREGRALARLSHPNVVAVHEVSDFAGQVYLVMEYVRGTTLRRWMNEPRSPAAIRDLFLQAGRGLAAAHAQGLVHRDFKPDNVLIGEDGRARVVDFGLVADPARAGEEADEDADLDVDLAAPLTRTGALPGTPAYMAPEVFAGRRADARSDQFSFCVALHEALHGERPFAGETVIELLAATSSGAIRAGRRGVPSWIAAVVRRGLSPEPGDRWPAMDALLAALAADPLAARARRIRQGVAAVALSAVAVALVLGGGELRRRWLAERREAEAAAQLAAVNARIDGARGRGDPAAAARAFEDFVADPRTRETAALADAWLGEARRRAADRAYVDATSADARAFVRARGATQRLAALDGLAAIFRVQQRWHALREVLATIDRVDPEAAAAPSRRVLAIEAALGERDARAALELLGPGEAVGVRGLVGRLVGGARRTTYDNITRIDDVDLEGDGERELMIQRIIPGGIGVDFVRADPELTPRLRLGTADLAPPRPIRVIPLAPDRNGRLLLLGSGVDHQLLAPGDRGLELRQRWDDHYSIAAAVGDLDGDGVDEIYVGTGPSTRHIIELVADDDGDLHPREPIPPGEAPGSDVQELLIADLDGDGRGELVVADGPWRAYDVRVYRRDADGSLRLRAREQLGSVYGVKTIRRGDRLLLAASHIPAYPSRVVFPEDRPTGEAPGIYLLRLDGDRLAREGFLPLPAAVDANVFVSAFGGVADVDGDGREDLGLAFTQGTRRSTAIWLQRADGGFTPVLLGDSTLLAIRELDGDPEPEALFVFGPDNSRGELWIVGAGDQAIPRVEAPDAAALAIDGDPPNEAWARARDLRAMGLHRDAAEVFEELARDGVDDAIVGRALFAAAGERELDGDLRRAAELFRRASAAPELVEEALRGAYRAHLGLGEHARASVDLDDLLRRPGIADRRALTAAQERLRPIVSGEAVLEFSFDVPLDPGWEIAAPLALRRDPIAGALAIDTTMIGPLLSRPIELIGDTFEIDVDLTIEAMEYSAGLHVVLEGATEDRIVGLYAVSSGGGRQVRRIYQCYFGGHPMAPRQRSTIEPAALLERVRMRVGAAASLGQSHCTLERGEDEGSQEWGASREDVALLAAPPGRYRLSITASDVEGAALFRGAIRRLAIRGARLVETPEEPTARLRHALVEGDHAGAGELLRARDAPLPPRERLWSADLRLRAGDLLGARADLATVLDGLDAAPTDPQARALRAELHTLLRRDGDLYGPVLASISPSAFLRHFAAAWTNAVSHHVDEAYVQSGILSVLDRVDTGPLIDGEEADVDLAIRLLLWRALAHARTGRGDEARAGLLRALALTERPGGGSTRAERRRDVLVELAALAIAAGDRATARERATRAIEAADDRIYTRDILRARAGLAAIVDSIP